MVPESALYGLDADGHRGGDALVQSVADAAAVCVLVVDGLYDAPHRGEMAAPPLRSRVRRLLPPR